METYSKEDLQDRVIELQEEVVRLLEEQKELLEQIRNPIGKRKKAPVLQMIRGGKE